MQEELEIKHDQIHLYVENPEASEPVIPIRWCVCKSVLDELQRREVKNPQLLIVVVREDQIEEILHRYGSITGPDNEFRYVVPLEQAMTHISFPRPGNYLLFATIVWRHYGSPRKWRKDAFSVKQNSCDNKTVWSNRALDYRDIESNKGYFLYYTFPCGFEYRYDETSLRINVLQEFFAKKPSGWLAKLANLGRETQPKDQCQFKQRLMTAPLFLPYFCVIYGTLMIFRYLYVLRLVLSGRRGINFKPLWNPLEMSTSDIWENAQSSVFETDAKDVDQPRYIQTLKPIYWICIFILTVALVAGSCKQFILKEILWIAVIYDLVLLAVVEGLCLIGRAFNEVMDFAASKFPNLNTFFQERKKLRIKAKDIRAQEKEYQREEDRKIELALFYNDDLAPVVCRSQPPKVKLDALPPERRTVWLRFQDFKRRVCKPFAR